MRRLTSSLVLYFIFPFHTQSKLLHHHQQQRRFDSSHDNKQQQKEKENSSSLSSKSFKKRKSPVAAALERSEDVAQREMLLDVERYFPTAISHIKKTPISPYIAEEGKAMEWKEIVQTVNVDGFKPSKEESSTSPSFFDEGSFDIRGRERYRKESKMQSISKQEMQSPDILQLSGGNAKQHGVAITNESNVSPADVTIEPESEESKNIYGDTPVQLTDMLKERLMELKAEKLREDRNDTYLPRRLNLLSDNDVNQRIERSKKQKNNNGSILNNKKLKGTPTTLADIDENYDNINNKDSNSSSIMSSINSNAINNLLRKSTDLIPGGSMYDPLTNISQNLDKLNEENNSNNSDGSVYLLRCLPRAGFCSRREALAIIASGQVKVDNVVERNPFRLIRAENNIHIASHSGRLRFAPPRLWMYHKPAHVIVSRNDIAGRTLITKHARILGMDHLVPVGSLPMRAHGLLLLSNDGELSRFLENPKSMIQRTYLLRIRPAIDPVLAHKLNTEGIVINGKRYNNVEFFVNPAMKSRFSLKIKIRGESMPISHLMQHLGRTVERGGRISFGPFSISGLAVGSIREVTVPPYYTQYSGSVWKEFVERDWPFFRRQRVSRLRRLSRYRELTPKELEELDNFTFEEIKDALSFESQELKTASMEHLKRTLVRPVLNEKPLPNDFETVDVDSNSEIPNEDEIIEDITAVI